MQPPPAPPARWPRDTVPTGGRDPLREVAEALAAGDGDSLAARVVRGELFGPGEEAAAPAPPLSAPSSSGDVGSSDSGSSAGAGVGNGDWLDGWGPSQPPIVQRLGPSGSGGASPPGSPRAGQMVSSPALPPPPPRPRAARTSSLGLSAETLELLSGGGGGDGGGGAAPRKADQQQQPSPQQQQPDGRQMAPWDVAGWSAGQRDWSPPAVGGANTPSPPSTPPLWKQPLPARRSQRPPPPPPPLPRAAGAAAWSPPAPAAAAATPPLPQPPPPRRAAASGKPALTGEQQRRFDTLKKVCCSLADHPVMRLLLTEGGTEAFREWEAALRAVPALEAALHHSSVSGPLKPFFVDLETDGLSARTELRWLRAG